MDLWTDGPMDGPTDGPTDGRTLLLRYFVAPKSTNRYTRTCAQKYATKMNEITVPGTHFMSGVTKLVVKCRTF